jgi:quinone-modifying oxidoreductase subunit QmoB
VFLKAPVPNDGEVPGIKTKIAVIPCKWHPLTAMENAAKDGFTYDASATVMPVKCTGLVKVSYLLKLFAKGMEGVLVLGCQEEDCRYFNGSKRCREIVDEAREILALAGVPDGRLTFHLVGESQGKEFVRIMKGFTKQFGKSPAKAKKVKAKKRRKRVASARRR